MSGAFTGQNYAGALVDYSIYESPTTGNTVTQNVGGVATLTRNGVTGNAVVANGTPAATGQYVVAQGGASGGNLQLSTTATLSNGVLTGFDSNGNSTNTTGGYTSTTSIVCVICTGQAIPDAATGIQMGTWDSGTLSNSFTSPLNGQVHWIKGPAPDPIYLPEVLLGTLNYTLDGGTAPTNQRGVVGSLTSASLAVNFTAQTVDIGLGLTTWSPLASGLLTGKYRQGIPAGSRGAMQNVSFLRDGLLDARKNAAVGELEAIAQRLDCSVAQLALAWVAHNPRVSTVILGASKLPQLQENLGALAVLPKLAPDVLARIDVISAPLAG
ncbi:L-glyceraldehyde 3-phosphate reductase [mine drainage metagenome]|uniref:L-glyceraldehyde 3-phosphate reductase n=1 Tax=mine drainage metagenome TaxID=410659 RepID=A0A1J5P283_9ZZZZ